MLSVAVIVFLAILSVYDVREKSLPLWLLLSGGALLMAVSLSKNGLEPVFLGCLPGMVLLLICLASPQSLGAGDGLTILAVGAAWGLGVCCRWLLIGFLLAAASGLWEMIVKKRNRSEQIALLPFLLLAAVGECLI